MKDRGGRGNKQGSTVLYAVFLAALLSILAAGYAAADLADMRGLQREMQYAQTKVMARTLHKSFCQAVNDGTSAAMGQIWESFAEDCRRACREYEKFLEEGEEEGWETFFRERMEGKRYILRGSGRRGEQEVEIVLSPAPLGGRAFVHTRVSGGGESFGLGGEIRFDNERGEHLTLPAPGEEAGMEICLTGRRVYRYWREPYTTGEDGFPTGEG